MMHFIINAYHNSLEFELPEIKDTLHWKRWIDTSLESPGDICDWQDAVIITTEKYGVQSHSVVVLVAEL